MLIYSDPNASFTFMLTFSYYETSEYPVLIYHVLQGMPVATAVVLCWEALFV
jgi:hypothetical protein